MCVTSTSGRSGKKSSCPLERSSCRAWSATRQTLSSIPNSSRSGYETSQTRLGERMYWREPIAGWVRACTMISFGRSFRHWWSGPNSNPTFSGHVAKSLFHRREAPYPVLPTNPLIIPTRGAFAEARQALDIAHRPARLAILSTTMLHWPLAEATAVAVPGTTPLSFLCCNESEN